MMIRVAAIVLFATVAALVLVGCGDFQQRAAQVETRISDAEDSAQIAQQAAAQSLARILELEGRVATLEQQVGILLDATEVQADPGSLREAE